MNPNLRSAIDWSKLAPLSLRARLVADGAHTGAHRSIRRGAGVEFGGHRAYTPGDDLRFIDRHALMRHGELLIREFETETDRELRLIVDATPSMAYRGSRSRFDKLGFSALLAAALAKIVVDGGDRVGLDWLGGEGARPLPAMSGGEGFERIATALEDAKAGTPQDAELGKALGAAERSQRGTIVVLLSDLLDLPSGAEDRVAALSARGRALVVVQTLDADEIEFPFNGPVRLTALEGELVVDTDANGARAGYLQALRALQTRWSDRLAARGGRFVTLSSNDDPIAAVVSILRALAGGSK